MDSSSRNHSMDREFITAIAAFQDQTLISNAPSKGVRMSIAGEAHVFIDGIFPSCRGPSVTSSQSAVHYCNRKLWVIIMDKSLNRSSIEFYRQDTGAGNLKCAPAMPHWDSHPSPPHAKNPGKATSPWTMMQPMTIDHGRLHPAAY